MQLAYGAGSSTDRDCHADEDGDVHTDKGPVHPGHPIRVRTRMPEPLPADSDCDGNRSPDSDSNVDADCYASPADSYADSDGHGNANSDCKPLCTRPGGRASVPDAYAATAWTWGLEK